jgi:hypothetical protein
MLLRVDTAAKAARAGVHAVHRSVSGATEQGQARLRDAVDATGRRADDALSAAEKIAIGVVDAIAQRGRTYAAAGKDRLYAVDAKLLPRRSRPPFATALVAVGAGILLSLLFRARPSRSV